MTTTGNLLRYVLDEPDLLAKIQTLHASHLLSLIREVGLEDSGEILAMVSSEQFLELMDESLWHQSKPGSAEVFDHERFRVWLEVMLEGGDKLAAQRLREIPEETLVLAFFGQMIVLDIETLGMGMAGASFHEAGLVEKALDACLYIELGGYTLVSRGVHGWDSMLEALMALDQIDHGLVERVLNACCMASTEYIEDSGGLHKVLGAADTMAEDAAADREDRRADKGFVATQDATAFLELARHTDVSNQESVASRDPISKAYFRRFGEGARGSSHQLASPRAEIPALRGLVVPSTKSLASPSAIAFSDKIRRQAPILRAQREVELMFVANALVASSLGLSPAEAAQLAIEVCARGLEQLERLGIDREDAMVNYGADQLFRMGWTVKPRGPFRHT